MFEREYRDLAHVPRWVIIPTLQKQSVAEHSYYVTLYSTHIMFKLRLDPRFTLPAIYHALEHDREEAFTGDIPGPSKKILGIVGKNLDTAVEESTRFQSNNFGGADPIALAIVKLADLMDQYAFWKEEGKLGNGRAGQMLNSIRPKVDAAGHALGGLVNAGLGEVDVTRLYIEDRILHEFYSQCNQDKLLPGEKK